MGKINMKLFVYERDKAFTEAVVNDNWEPVWKYCCKYKIPVPHSEKSFKGGIYIAVKDCAGIPEEVKKLADRKYKELFDKEG